MAGTRRRRRPVADTWRRRWPVDDTWRRRWRRPADNDGRRRRPADDNDVGNEVFRKGDGLGLRRGRRLAGERQGKKHRGRSCQHGAEESHEVLHLADGGSEAAAGGGPLAGLDRSEVPVPVFHASWPVGQEPPSNSIHSGIRRLSRGMRGRGMACRRASLHPGPKSAEAHLAQGLLQAGPASGRSTPFCPPWKTARRSVATSQSQILTPLKGRGRKKESVSERSSSGAVHAELSGSAPCTGNAAVQTWRKDSLGY